MKKQKQEAVILSLDALGADGMSGESFIADTQINVEEETVHNIMLENYEAHSINFPQKNYCS